VGFLADLAAHANAQMPQRVHEALWARGVSDQQIALFKIGWLSALPALEVPDEFKAWWAGHRWRLVNTYVFPLTNALGDIQGLQFRDVDENRRGYLDYFGSKEEPIFFGLAQAMPSIWDTETVWLVEGVFDLCPLQRHLSNIISTIHAGVSKQLWRLLRRMVRRIHLAYDVDRVGAQVSYDIVREMGRHFEIKVVKFPRIPFRDRFAKDPNEFWSIWGDDRLGAFARAQDY
jgi:DNA primase